MTFSLEVISPVRVAEGTFADDFLGRCDFGGFEAEQENVAIILDRVKENTARLHVLSDGENATIYGFAALHLTSYSGSPSAVIDFLFTASPFRKQKFQDLDNLKISEYLLVHAIDTAHKVSAVLPIKYVILQTIDDKLLPFYGGYGFKVVDDVWMALMID